ncbi:MAG: hypothetical protein HOF72_06165, partial [Planctomycetaceae bacterium]|nr:hypothetical protein [Planctomycetaceae bacterium]
MKTRSVIVIASSLFVGMAALAIVGYSVADENPFSPPRPTRESVSQQSDEREAGTERTDQREVSSREQMIREIYQLRKKYNELREAGKADAAFEVEQQIKKKMAVLKREGDREREG